MSDLESRVTELERLMRGIDSAKIANTPTIKIRETIRVGVDGYFGRNLFVGNDISAGDLIVTGGMQMGSWGLYIGERTGVLATPPSGYGAFFASIRHPRWVNDAGSDFGACVDRYWFDAVNGWPVGPATGNISQAYGYLFSDVSAEYINWSCFINPAWSGMRARVKVYWAAAVAGAGNIRHICEIRQAQAGTNLAGGTSYLGVATVKASAGNGILVEDDVNMGVLQSWSTGMISFRWCRTPADAADTFVGDILLLGAMFYITYP